MKSGLSPRLLGGSAALLACLALAGCGAARTPVSQSTAPSGSASSSAKTSSAPASSTPPSPITVNSMTVITQPEASAALGQTVRAPVLGKATVEGGVAGVFYGPSVPAGADPDVPVPNSVRVVLVTGPNAQKWFNDYRSKVKAVPLTGLGDEAYYDGDASVSVLKDDAYIRIAVIGARGISLPAEKKLAADALPRI